MGGQTNEQDWAAIAMTEFAVILSNLVHFLWANIAVDVG